MAYNLHIERTGGIPLEEWQQALREVPRARETSEDWVGTLPDGTEIRRLNSPGDGELLLPVPIIGWLLGWPRYWQKALTYFDGKVTFKPAFDVDNPRDPARRIIAELANHLGAQIVGDADEIYDW